VLYLGSGSGMDVFAAATHVGPGGSVTGVDIMPEQLAKAERLCRDEHVSFRHARIEELGRFATGVAFVTAAPDGEPTGLIVNSLTSVSLEPPLVSFCPSRSSLTWSRMRRAGRFGVNVLGRHKQPFAERATPAGADRFAGLDWTLGPGGAPLLTDALASFECEIVAEHRAGDHWIVVGRVDNLRITPVNEPLVFFAGEFGTFQWDT